MAKPLIPRPDRRSIGIFGLVLTAAVLVWSSLLWLLGQAAAVAFSGHAMPVSVLGMTSVSYQLPQHWNDPAQAYPPELRAQLPDAAGFYIVTAIVLVGRQS